VDFVPEIGAEDQFDRKAAGMSIGHNGHDVSCVFFSLEWVSFVMQNGGNGEKADEDEMSSEQWVHAD
jgi:hypothetical protein